MLKLFGIGILVGSVAQLPLVGCTAQPSPEAAERERAIERKVGWISPHHDAQAREMGLLGPVSPVPPPSLATFAGDIATCGAIMSVDYEEALRQCARLVWTSCVSRSWDAVRPALEEQGVQLVVEERGYTPPFRGYRWTAVADSYRGCSGTVYALVLEFSVAPQARFVRRDNALYPVYDGPDEVIRVEARLEGNPGRTISDMKAAPEFHKGSAADFALWPTRPRWDIPLDWPVDRLTVSYGPYQPPSPYWTDTGYSIWLEMHDPSQAEERTRSLARVVSHRDPAPIFNMPRTWLSPPPWFVPSREFEPVDW